MHRASFILIGAIIVTACMAVQLDKTDATFSDASTTPATSATSISSFVASVPSVAFVPPAKGLNVPFTPQAPFANWDALHEEACEEAAILMVAHYLDGTPLTPKIAEREILDLVAWERDHGFGDDVSAAQMAEIAIEKFGLRARVRADVTEDTIKEELANGNPVIVPAAGRDLGNPYFSGKGPWYHALAIIGFESGWTGDWLIVNDPGTKRGHRYAYRVETLLQAIHDWTGVKEEIRSGEKAMVILEK